MDDAPSSDYLIVLNRLQDLTSNLPQSSSLDLISRCFMPLPEESEEQIPDVGPAPAAVGRSCSSESTDSSCSLRSRGIHRDQQSYFHKAIKRLASGKGVRKKCALCGEQVQGNEPSLKAHVHGHSPNALFTCNICHQYETKSQHSMYGHLLKSHQRRDMETRNFIDQRDFGDLMQLLEDCFPSETGPTSKRRRVTKCTARVNKIIDQLLKLSDDYAKAMRLLQADLYFGGRSKAKCSVCEQQVVLCDGSRYDLLHPLLHISGGLKCLHCSKNFTDPTALAQHLAEQHFKDKVRLGLDYGATFNSRRMPEMLEKCFKSDL